MSESLKSEFTIALDAMGGDLGPEIVILAAKESLEKHESLRIVFFGKEKELTALCQKNISDQKRINIVDAQDVVEMADSPVDSIRNKKNSSMRIALDYVKEKKVDACVSAGNTGALMATAKFVLKMLPGISRPAIIAELPAKKKTVHMLDLGANIRNDPEQLFQFALMGSIVSSDICEILNPKVALLNIGEEDLKGNENVKNAAHLLSQSSLNYIGFIEGNEIFSGKTDVVVTDGFSGNIALKSIEGTVEFVTSSLTHAYKKNWLTRLQALMTKSVLSDLMVTMDSRKYNGASLVGLDGIVIKSHGGADAFAFHHAIETAIVEVKHQVPNQIRSLLEKEAS